MKSTIFIIVLLFLINSGKAQTDTTQQFKIGDHYGGGIIFSIDPTGQHGLIAAPSVQATNVKWSSISILTNARFIDDGLENTKIILESMKEWSRDPKTATFVCDNLTIEEFSDWYLPSVQELIKMHVSQESIGNFLSGYYWSSTE
nr:hypothetical protein [Candidatus Brocadiales bacterium]